MNAQELDLLIDAAVTAGEVSARRKVSGSLPAALFAGGDVQERAAKKPNWTREEEEFVIEHYTSMSDAEIGEALGRTAIAIHVHREREMDLPAPSKSPGIVTVNRASKMLGYSSSHAMEEWFDEGIIPGYVLPGGNMCRLIRTEDLTRWVCNPENWIYLDIERIRDERLRRMAIKRRERWGDAWLSTPEVARIHGVGTSDVKRYIKLGYLKARQSERSISGRHPNRRWKLWFVLRSEATRPGLRIWTRDLIRTGRREWSAAADAWILRARDDLEMSFPAIGRSMKRSGELVRMRYYRLKRE